MTKEEIIDGLELYTVGRLKKDRVHITVEELQKFIDEIKSLEQGPTQINAIPKDYVYDTETEDFVVYRHKYTCEEIHIKKPIPVYTLEQEPCEDAVSREQAKKAIRDKFKDLPSRVEINAILNELPSVTPTACIAKVVFNKDEFQKMVDERVKELVTLLTQEWIPVSERLPEEDGEYLLFGKIDEDEENYIFIGEYDSCGEQFGIWQEQFDRTTLGYLGSEFFEYSSVIAWMPLPKPYKAESEDKK